MTSNQTARPPSAVIARLAAPLVGYFFIQSAASLAGLAVVGRLGEAALAGVGAGGALYGVLLSLMFGVDAGVQAIVSRNTGAGRTGTLGAVLAEAWTISLPLGALLAAVLWTVAPGALAAMLPDPSAAADGAAYVRGIAPSLVLIAVTLPINACWIGSGRPALTLGVTLLLAPVQVLATVLLAPAVGAGGAGAAVSVASLIGVVLSLALASRSIPGLLRTRPSGRGVATIAVLGWPISLQQALLQLGLMVAFIIVARLGTAATATINVLVSLSTAPIQTAVGLGTAAATLVGQSLGRGRPAEARLWGWRTALGGVAVTAPLGLIALLAPGPLLSLFLHDPATVAAGLLPARIMGATVVIDTAGRILCFALRGAGATRLGAGLPFAAQWLGQLPLMAVLGVGLGWGVMGVVIAQGSVALVEGIVTALIWAGPWWTRVRIGPRPEPSPAEIPGRIAVLGGAGSGKSTLARRLAALGGGPVTHLDRLIFGPDWVFNPLPQVRAQVAAVAAGEAWIIEGTWPQVSDLILPRADLVLWIDQPAWLRLWRAWRKMRLGRIGARADRPDGCQDSFGWAYAGEILRFGAWSPALEQQLRAACGGRLLRLKGDRAVARFLKAMAPAATSPGKAIKPAPCPIAAST